MLFFPSHDIALGNGVRHFNPPAAALTLQQDLAWLAGIWNQGLDSPLPWGWDWDTREHIARNLGIKRINLPTDSDLEALRQLSSRHTTISILEGLDYQGPMPRYLASEDELDAFISGMKDSGRDFVLKTPWSSSGRGLIRSSVTDRETMTRRALATIRRMGGIMAETWLPKAQDFAMLFFVGHERTTFIGYSLFDNEDNGTYRQGYLMSNDIIEDRLVSSVKTDVRHQLRQLQTSIPILLDRMFAPFFGLPWQVGYVGIDMMTLRPEAQPLGIMPCVEMNLRCTMGVVSRLWADRNMKAGQTGRFCISPMLGDGHFEARFIIDA